MRFLFLALLFIPGCAAGHDASAKTQGGVDSISASRVGATRDTASSAAMSPAGTTGAAGPAAQPAAPGTVAVPGAAGLSAEIKKLRTDLSAPIRGLYINRFAAQSTKKMQRLIGVADSTEINAFVIDIKLERHIALDLATLHDNFVNEKIAELLDHCAVQLGADVAFFLRGGAAWAEGIGEKLVSVPFQGGRWIVVIYPGVSVSTREAYQELDRYRKKIGVKKFFIDWNPDRSFGSAPPLFNSSARSFRGSIPQRKSSP